MGRSQGEGTSPSDRTYLALDFKTGDGAISAEAVLTIAGILFYLTTN